jgi:transcription-repair coupling factor (superfamily II helicase)
VPAPGRPETKKGIADGSVDIVVGTHALLGKSIQFRDLGLLIIDEEQHFGVKHKERLKELKSDVHVLTLSATPIPRTLQLALTGVRELSLIATPPVDRSGGADLRLAVRPACGPRGAAAGTLSRRPEFLCLSAPVGYCLERKDFLSEEAVPEAESRRGAWPDATGRAGRRHERLL